MSRTSIAFGTAVALAFGASLGAQSPSTSTPSSSASQTPPAITVTGCLTSDQAAGATGTSGTAGAAATAASGFKLTNAMAGAAADKASGTAGATAAPGAAPSAAAGAASSAASGQTYTLGGNTSELSKHVNHQVRITGKLAPAAAASKSSTPAAPGSMAAGSQSAQRLDVESVTMIAATCSK